MLVLAERADGGTGKTFSCIVAGIAFDLSGFGRKIICSLKECSDPDSSFAVFRTCVNIVIGLGSGQIYLCHEVAAGVVLEQPHVGAYPHQV